MSGGGPLAAGALRGPPSYAGEGQGADLPRRPGILATPSGEDRPDASHSCPETTPLPRARPRGLGEGGVGVASPHLRTCAGSRTPLRSQSRRPLPTPATSTRA